MGISTRVGPRYRNAYRRREWQAIHGSPPPAGAPNSTLPKMHTNGEVAPPFIRRPTPGRKAERAGVYGRRCQRQAVSAGEVEGGDHERDNVCRRHPAGCARCPISCGVLAVVAAALPARPPPYPRRPSTGGGVLLVDAAGQCLELDTGAHCSPTFSPTPEERKRSAADVVVCAAFPPPSPVSLVLTGGGLAGGSPWSPPSRRPLTRVRPREKQWRSIFTNALSVTLTQSFQCRDSSDISLSIHPGEGSC